MSSLVLGIMDSFYDGEMLKVLDDGDFLFTVFSGEKNENMFAYPLIM